MTCSKKTYAVNPLTGEIEAVTKTVDISEIQKQIFCTAMICADYSQNEDVPCTQVVTDECGILFEEIRENPDKDIL